MFQKDTPVSVSLSKAALLIWLVFTTLYFLLSVMVPMIVGKVQSDLISQAQIQGQKEGYTTAMQSMSGNAYQNGYTTAVTQLVWALDKQITDGCKEPVPVTIGTGSVGIISIPCVQKLQETSAQSGAVLAPKK